MWQGWSEEPGGLFSQVTSDRNQRDGLKLCCAKGCLDWVSRGISLQKEWEALEHAAQNGGAVLTPGLRRWFSSGVGSIKLMVGLHDLTGLFQPRCTFDSVSFLLFCISWSVSLYRSINFHSHLKTRCKVPYTHYLPASINSVALHVSAAITDSSAFKCLCGFKHL